MKRFIFAMLFVALAAAAGAQNFNAVRTMEYEIGFGLAKGDYIGNENNPTKKWGGKFYFDVRANLYDTPFDVGLQVGLSAFNREFSAFDTSISEPIFGKTNYQSLSAVVFSDYNYRRWRHVSLFAGLGVGVAGTTYNNSGDVYSSSKDEGTAFTCVPRIGVEFYSRIRFTTEYRYVSRDGFSHVAFSLGFVLNGGLKKSEKRLYYKKMSDTY